ncbi:MAG: ROK family glucokinase [Clostridiales bacterium]|nr:ROK family glucokinase [Clostridiales bacterium]
MGGTEVKIGLFEENGIVAAKTSIPTRHDDNCGHVLEDAAEKIDSILKDMSISKENVIGIGIGIPGPVVGGIVKHCVNLGWSSSVDAAGIMKKLTGINSSVLNDANAAALGEQWFGGARGCDSMVLATIGTGIGGGIVVGGNILTGKNGAGGEIGHITVEYENGRQCNCGRKGCLENYASATGIVATAAEVLEKYVGKSILDKNSLSAKSVFDAAAKGDEAALETVEIFGRYLGRALANIATIVDPDVIVLGGGVVKAGEIVRAVVEKYYRESAFKTVADTRIVLAELANDAGIYGAASYAIKNK